MADLLSYLPGIVLLGSIGSLTHLILSRLFLSPLSSIPGPKLAALTYWYECYYDIVKPAQFVFKIKELHQKYGPVVRIGPNDVSISDPDFIDDIYASRPGHKRDKNPKYVRALGISTSIGGSVAHELHRSRREALNPFFSPQRIHRLDSDLMDKVAQVESHFQKARDSGQVLDLLDLYFAFCNDVVNKYCFGNDPNLLQHLPVARLRRTKVASVLGSVKIMLHFSWVRSILQMLPQKSGAGDMMMFRRHVRAKIDEVLASDASQDQAVSIFTHLRDSEDIPTTEKSPQRLEDEAVLMTMAGTYSPMLSLVIAHYYLLAHPDMMWQLRHELATNPAAITAAELERLPYLSGIVQEAHRLSFGMTGRNPRVCPDEPLVYASEKEPGRTYTLPAGTSLSVSTLVIHTDESLFPSPWTFDPERWIPTAPASPGIGKAEREKQAALVARRRRALLSFMRGPRTCIGRHLANAEMAVLIAAMARWDLRLFETDETDVKFKHDYHVLRPSLESKGVRVRVHGRSEYRETSPS
ncbi:cytochrome P450 [Xylaria sp. CBS 124048]|nr:cytochrome P450 [Xylaria sp. CBS 124048]